MTEESAGYRAAFLELTSSGVQEEKRKVLLCEALLVAPTGQVLAVVF